MNLKMVFRFCFNANGFATKRVDMGCSQSKISRLFSRKVVPVSVISTIASASPTSGASSTEPSILMISRLELQSTVS